MASPLSDVGISLAKTHVLRILEDARNAEAKLNRQLADDGKEPLPPFFFTAEQVDAIRAEHAEALGKLKPTEPPKYFWSRGDKMSPQRGASPSEAFAEEHAQAAGGANPIVALDIASIACVDKSISDSAFRSIIATLSMFFRPSPFGGRRRIPLAHQLAAKNFIDAALPSARQAGASSGEITRSKPSPTPEPAEPVATPADREAAVSLLRQAIESGRVVELPGSGARILHERE